MKKITKRRVAAWLGHKTYTSVCIHHGCVQKLTSVGRCVLCDKNRSAKSHRTYYDKNRARELQRSKTHYHNNKDDSLRKSLAYFHNNRDKYKKYASAYYNNNKDTINATHLVYRTNNKEMVTHLTRRWNKNNPHKSAWYSKQRHAKMIEATPSWYKSEEYLVAAIYLKRNELRDLWGAPLEVDHIIPIVHDKVCGLHCWANLQLLDKTTNRSKSNKYDITTTW